MHSLAATIRGSGAGGALLGLFLGVVAWASPTLAETPSDWLERYEVESACPAAATFRSMVLGRLIDHPDALARLRVQVEISRSAGAWLGRLSSADVDGRRIWREVVDGSCSALAQALSWVVALSVEEALSDSAAERSAPPQ